jgi:hypothetical protein
MKARKKSSKETMKKDKKQNGYNGFQLEEYERILRLY